MAQLPERPLGQSGVHVSALGFGSWMTLGHTVTDHGAVQAIIATAIDMGVTFFDTADSYAGGEAERVLGRSLSPFPRDRLVLSTKVFYPLSDDPADRGLSRRHIFHSIERSLRHLRTDYVDLYFCHRPDPATPIAETIQAMNDLISQGKIRRWGTSEWSPARIARAWKVARQNGWRGPEIEQPQYSLIRRTRFEAFVAPALTDHGMRAVTWSPLASGILTGKYAGGVPPASRLATVDWLQREWLKTPYVTGAQALGRVAAEVGCTSAQLAIAYAASHPAVASVILGATTANQLRENLGAATVVMTPELQTRLRRLFPQPFKQRARGWVERFERVS